ncbi:type VII toxin-antitoxin system HepT family RNase toxin [Halomonas sp. WWR20]
MLENHFNAAYIDALENHLDECEADIEVLRSILAERPWSRIERHAAERTLQVLIEGCIGVAKHWARRETGHISGEALTAFQRLTDKGVIGGETPWRKIIGLRNVLVHDYLEVDTEIVRDIVEQEHYRALLAFSRNALQALQR